MVEFATIEKVVGMMVWDSCGVDFLGGLITCKIRRNKIAEAEAAVSVNEKKCLALHMHVQLKLDELQGPPNPWPTVT
jgi:hypothetical protein